MTKHRTWLFFLVCFCVIYLRLFYQGSYFPPVFEGEEAQILTLAESITKGAAHQNSWLRIYELSMSEYNKGYGWFFAPLYAHFGYDVRLLTVTFSLFISLLGAFLFTLYRTVSPRGSLWSFLLVAVFALLVECVRRYKWHTVTYVSALSVYLYFLPQILRWPPSGRGRWLKLAAMGLFLASCFFYFGAVIYAIPFGLLIFLFGAKTQPRRTFRIAGGVLILFLGAAWIAFTQSDLWRNRITAEFVRIYEMGNWSGLHDREDFLERFFFVYLSLPFRIAVIAGLVASFPRIRRGDSFVLINTVLLVFNAVFLFSIGAFNNADQLNWIMIPLLGLGLIGADSLFVPLRDCVKFGSALCALIALPLAWHEIHYYPEVVRQTSFQAHMLPEDSETQAALVLRLIKEDSAGSIRYFLPDPAVREPDGGFNYNTNLRRTDYAATLSRVVFFKTAADLSTGLSRLPRGSIAVVFMSTGLSPASTDNAFTPDGHLLGVAPEIIFPYEQVYRIRFPVRRYVLPLPTATPG